MTVWLGRFHGLFKARDGARILDIRYFVAPIKAALYRLKRSALFR